MVKGRNKYRIKDIFDLSAGGDVNKEHFLRIRPVNIDIQFIQTL